MFYYTNLIVSTNTTWIINQNQILSLRLLFFDIILELSCDLVHKVDSCVLFVGLAF